MLARGGKPEGLRELRQRKTRLKILGASRLLFRKNRFHHVPVDDIARLAKISRGTFYLHFKDKDAVLRALVRLEFGGSTQRYERLVGLDPICLSDIEAWIWSCREEYLQRRQWLMGAYIAYDSDPEFMNDFSAVRDRYVEILGTRFPWFDLELLPGEAREYRRAECHLLFFQLEQFCLHSVFPRWSVDDAAMVRVLAQRFAVALNCYA